MPLDWSAQADPVTCIAILDFDSCAAMVSGTAFQQLWDWTREQQRPDLRRQLCLLNLPLEAHLVREMLLRE